MYGVADILSGIPYMVKMLLLLLVTCVLGATLSFADKLLPIRPGLLGGIAMIVIANWMRVRWAKDGAVAPEAPQRTLWLTLGCASVMFGFMLAGLWAIGPEMVMHSPATHAYGVETWTLVIAAVVAYRVARDRRPRRDERDELIAAQGVRAGYNALLLQMLVLVLLLGFDPFRNIAQLSSPMLAHILIAGATLAAIVQYAVALSAYLNDPVADPAVQ